MLNVEKNENGSRYLVPVVRLCCGQELVQLRHFGFSDD